ncbi:hypothetical protein [Oceaniglobus indicus]|uniref:hypothetical protein n=1 Tax=Oceaniglobus indicus TaxID=2047749 RepID=UPI000C192A16|nr:hypothetical protein [Oceaniglobus indicus]
MMRHVTHPGPVAEDRLDLLPVEGKAIEVMLRPGIPLEDAVAQAMADAGCDGGYLDFNAAPVSALEYVIPAHSSDADHVAWYSDIHSFDGAGVIDHMVMIVGTHDGKSFLHGHGRWTPEGGTTALGHILAPRTVLSEPVRATGIGVTGGRFERRHDPETNFDLFQTTGAGVRDADHALLRIRPNVDFDTALGDACARLGWDAARAFGLGSLNETDFEDGSHLDSLPSEFLILDAPVGQTVNRGPHIDIVGVDGGKLYRGYVERGANPVLITAEIVLKRMPVADTTKAGS